MSRPPAREIIDITTLDRIVEVLQLRNTANPDEARAAALADLYRIRNMIVHGDGMATDDYAPAMLTALVTLEMTSLGTANARRVRARATAAQVARILDRSEEPDSDPKQQQIVRPSLASPEARELRAATPQLEPDFVRFFRKEYDQVVLFVMRCGANLADAEDAAQEAFMAAWKYMRTSSGLGAIADPRGWVRSVALRQHYRLSTAWSRQQAASPVSPLPETPASASQDPAELAAERLLVLNVLHSLDREARAVMAFHLDGLTSPEIASQLGITPQKTCDVLKRARRILRAGLVQAEALAASAARPASAGSAASVPPAEQRGRSTPAGKGIAAKHLREVSPAKDLRSSNKRWEQTCQVPGNSYERLEYALRRIDNKVSHAEEAQWTADLFRSLVAGLEQELAAATA
jgi:RNA polymerase sigma factor (sigma-70 family)